MMPTTPSGTGTCLSWRPLGSVDPRRTSPTGSGRPATCRSLAAIASTHFASSDSRSISASDRPLSRPRVTSFAFAASTSSVCATRASAIASSAWSLAAGGIEASRAAAARARRATSSTWSAEASAVTPEGYDGSARAEPGRRRREVLLPPGEHPVGPELVDALGLVLRRPMLVLRFVRVEECRQQGDVHRLHPAFDDDDVVAAVQVDDHVGPRDEVARLQRNGVRREDDPALEPQPPHRHRVRPPIRTSRTDPVVAGSSALSLDPRPRQLAVSARGDAITTGHGRPIRNDMSNDARPTYRQC